MYKWHFLLVLILCILQVILSEHIVIDGRQCCFHSSRDLLKDESAFLNRKFKFEDANSLLNVDRETRQNDRRYERRDGEITREDTRLLVERHLGRQIFTLTEHNRRRSRTPDANQRSFHSTLRNVRPEPDIQTYLETRRAQIKNFRAQDRTSTPRHATDMTATDRIASRNDRNLYHNSERIDKMNRSFRRSVLNEGKILKKDTERHINRKQYRISESTRNEHEILRNIIRMKEDTNVRFDRTDTTINERDKSERVVLAERDSSKESSRRVTSGYSSRNREEQIRDLKSDRKDRKNRERFIREKTPVNNIHIQRELHTQNFLRGIDNKHVTHHKEYNSLNDRRDYRNNEKMNAEKTRNVLVEDDLSRQKIEPNNIQLKILQLRYKSDSSVCQLHEQRKSCERFKTADVREAERYANKKEITRSVDRIIQIRSDSDRFKDRFVVRSLRENLSIREKDMSVELNTGLSGVRLVTSERVSRNREQRNAQIRDKDSDSNIEKINNRNNNNNERYPAVNRNIHLQYVKINEEQIPLRQGTVRLVVRQKRTDSRNNEKVLERAPPSQNVRRNSLARYTHSSGELEAEYGNNRNYERNIKHTERHVSLGPSIWQTYIRNTNRRMVQNREREQNHSADRVEAQTHSRNKLEHIRHRREVENREDNYHRNTSKYNRDASARRISVKREMTRIGLRYVEDINVFQNREARIAYLNQERTHMRSMEISALQDIDNERNSNIRDKRRMVYEENEIHNKNERMIGANNSREERPANIKDEERRQSRATNQHGVLNVEFTRLETEFIRRIPNAKNIRDSIENKQESTSDLYREFRKIDIDRDQSRRNIDFTYTRRIPTKAFGTYSKSSENFSPFYWQYLFYAIQGFYILIVFKEIFRQKETNKKTNSLGWPTQRDIKVD